jgi:hypothetical protein
MKTYTLEITVDDENKMRVRSTNTGFSPLELLGLLDLKRDDVLRQVKGEIKPDVFKRDLIEE